MESLSFKTIDLPTTVCKMRFHKRPIAAVTIGVPLLFLVWVFVIKSPSSTHNGVETYQQQPPNLSPTKEAQNSKMLPVDEMSAPESLAFKQKEDHSSQRHKEKNKLRGDNSISSTHAGHKKSTSDPRKGGIIDTSVRLPVLVGGLTKGEPVPQYELEGLIESYGVNGAPVQLSGEDQRLAEEIMRKEAFNVYISDRVSLHRDVPDTRDYACRQLSYDNKLPSASVVIIFTNEAYSTLLRTIWSVLDKSADHPETVHEIILVDDFSDRNHLHGDLDRYIKQNFPPKVKLLRLSKREGLIRARLAGARYATGDILVFLDSHCECGDDWLRPLLARIKEDKNVFAVPIIDVIDDKTLEYYHGNGNYFQVGGFTWSGHFTWVDISDQEMTRRGSPIAPTRSPTMAGGLFAVDRDTFWKLGSYDEEMDVWGGENLEMSFRIWQCGGVLETIPCSRVGHIFRSFHPYTFPGNKDTHGINTARTVEVWMDDYKRLFYMHRPDLLNSDIGSVSNRLKFKQDLQCKPFSWFLKNVYPEKFILDDPKHVFAYGRLKNPTSNTCLDNLQNDDKDSYDLGEYACHNFMASAQFFSFSKKYELRREDNCAQVSAPFPQRHEKVEMATCHGQGGEQDWAHTKEGKIIHKETKKCLDAGRGQSMDLLYVAPCQNIPSQVWYFDHYLN